VKKKCGVGKETFNFESYKIRYRQFEYGSLFLDNLNLEALQTKKRRIWKPK
jgi:hypothetical protein